MSSSPNYPFPSRTSMYWETCHVTYDQAVEMFNGQTATLKAMGHNPILSSNKLIRTEYPSRYEAQRKYSDETIKKSKVFEENLIKSKDSGSKGAQTLIDKINNEMTPSTEDVKNEQKPQVKKVGDGAETYTDERIPIMKKILSENNIVIRKDWDAKSAKSPLSPDWDFDSIVLHHAGNSFGCSNNIADIQNEHLEKYDD
ncbi:hypothetical protein C1141_20675, partial [Vibrio agarivorans]